MLLPKERLLFGCLLLLGMQIVIAHSVVGDTALLRSTILMVVGAGSLVFLMIASLTTFVRIVCVAYILFATSVFLSLITRQLTYVDSGSPWFGFEPLWDVDVSRDLDSEMGKDQLLHLHLVQLPVQCAGAWLNHCNITTSGPLDERSVADGGGCMTVHLGIAQESGASVRSTEMLRVDEIQKPIAGGDANTAWATQLVFRGCRLHCNSWWGDWTGSHISFVLPTITVQLDRVEEVMSLYDFTHDEYSDAIIRDMEDSAFTHSIRDPVVVKQKTVATVQGQMFQQQPHLRNAWACAAIRFVYYLLPSFTYWLLVLATWVCCRISASIDSADAAAAPVVLPI